MPHLCLRSTRILVAGLTLLSLLSGPAVWAERIELVSRTLPELVSDTAVGVSALAPGQQVRPMVSFDGRWTVFVSSAPNLVPGQVDFNNGDDIFLYDRVNGTVALVSHANGALSTAGDRVSGTPSISSDGRWIAFFSQAGNLAAGQVESNAGEDVFLYDRDTAAVTLVSHIAASSVTTGIGVSLDPVVSANGNAVAFVSRAINLMTGQVDTGANDDIFYWDRATNTTTLVSHIGTSTATSPSGSLSSVPVISADGSSVAYTSGATNLVAGESDTNGRLDVYLWTRSVNVNEIVSRSNVSGLTTGNGTASSARLSADGIFVLFRSDGTNHVVGQSDFNSGTDLFLYNRNLGIVTLVSRNSSSATSTGNVSTTLDGLLSADGNWVVFAGRANDYVSGQSDSNTVDDVFLWSRASGTTILVTRRAGTTTTAASSPSSGGASAISISADGSVVGHLTRATDLVSGQSDTNGLADVFVFDRATGTNVLAGGTAGSAAATANNAAKTIAGSGDGQWIAFATAATDILPGVNDTNGSDDVLLFGLAARNQILVSRRDANMPSATAGGDSTVAASNFANPVPNSLVSADGRWLAFQSTASQLISGQVDTNGTNDVFLYDRSTGTTTLVSRAAGTTLTAGNGESRAPVISADGRWVSFVTRASNLVPSSNDGNAADDVYLWDRVTGTMALVSHNSSSPLFAAGGTTPTLSSDASAVLFLSSAPDVVPGQSDTSSSQDVFSYDRATGTITLVSHNRFSTTSAQGGGDPSISADGRFVAFSSSGTSFIPSQNDITGLDVFQWDRTTDTFMLVSRHGLIATTTSGYSGHLAMSADGNWIAFSSAGTNLVPGVSDTNAQTDLFLWERATNTNRLISRSATSATVTANNATQGSMLSANGGLLVFLSRATNLVSGTDTNGGNDTFVYDRATGQIRLASHTTTSTVAAGNNVSRVVAVSADGSRVSFLSSAGNLVAGDTSGTFDVFLYDPATGAVRLASYRAGTSSGLFESCEGGSLSADGKIVPFSSLDRNVVANDFNARQDTFLWIDETGTDLAIAKTNGVSSVVPGQAVTYTITAINSGPTPTGATVTDTFPAALQGVTWTCVAGGGASCAASGAGSLSQAVNLPVNGTVTFTVTGTVAADATGTLANTASITPTGGVTDPNLTNNAATDADPLTPQADLSISMTDAPDPVQRGTILTYLISVTNAGPSAAASVSMTDTLPAGTTFAGASGTGWSCAPAAGAVTCTRPSLAPGSAPAITIQVIAPTTRGIPSLTNTVSISAATPDPVAANNAASATTSVLQPGITVAPVAGLTTTEAGGTASFSVGLDTAPLADVTISLASTDTAEGTVSPASLTFTTGDWSTPRTVTVTGVNDDEDDGNIAFTIVTSPAASSDVGYDGIDPADVAATNEDDDVAGIVVTPTEGLTTTEAGGTATFTVALTSRPHAGVTVALASSDTAEGTVSPASLTFTEEGWSTLQTVTVNGVNDDYDDGDTAYTITTGTATSTDTGYAGIDPADVAASNQDDDTAGIVITPAEGLTTTEAGGTATFTVVLASRPRADVTIPLASSETAEGTVSPASLTFTEEDWSTPQTVTVTGVNDDYDDGDAAYTVTTGTAASTDTGYAGIDPADVAVSNQDDDTAGFVVAPVAGLTTTEAGGTATFTVALTSRPRADVTIPLASSETAEGTVSPVSLTFTEEDWSTPQTVTVTGVNDDYDDGDAAYTITTGAAASTDTGYAGIDPTDVAVSNQDDDTAGFVVAPTAGLTTTEAGGTATFTVVLTSRPRADVTIPLASSDTAEGTVSPASLTFTGEDWSAPRTVTVTGVNDDFTDGNTAYTITTGAAASTDAGYAGINPADVAVSNQDDDTAGIVVTPTEGLTTTEAGGTATFTVVLAARPRADVTIAVESDDTAEGTADPASLTFTSEDWSTPKTVTVTGVDDDYADGDTAYTITTGAAQSTDAAWAGIDPADVAATNEDDDTAGIVVTPTAGLITTEGGGTATFTVVLAARPAEDVTIALTSSDPGEGQPSPASLTFTSDNWDTPQTVTVTGQDDDLRDGDAAYTITLAPAESADPAFDGIDPADVAATNRDDSYEGVFHTITPCRLVDTRQPGYGPPLENNRVAIVAVHGTCGIPPTAKAVSMNLTFSGAGQPGTVLVYPGDLAQPPVAEYLWIRAGNFARSLWTLMPLGGDGTLAVLPRLKAPKLNPTVHIVLDVSGYFE